MGYSKLGPSVTATVVQQMSVSDQDLIADLIDAHALIHELYRRRAERMYQQRTRQKLTFAQIGEYWGYTAMHVSQIIRNYKKCLTSS